MKNVIAFIKRIFTIVKDWIVANGVEGVLGLLAGLVLWIFGYKIYAGFAFGVFATRNWDLLKSWITSKIKGVGGFSNTTD